METAIKATAVPIQEVEPTFELAPASSGGPAVVTPTKTKGTPPVVTPPATDPNDEHTQEEVDGDNDDEVYEVESLLEFRKYQGREQVLIKWKGYRRPTWEPAENFQFKEDAEEEKGVGEEDKIIDESEDDEDEEVPLEDDDEEQTGDEDEVVLPSRGTRYRRLRKLQPLDSTDRPPAKKGRIQSSENASPTSSEKELENDLCHKPAEVRTAPSQPPPPQHQHTYLDPVEEAYVNNLPSDASREKYRRARDAFAGRPDLQMDDLKRALQAVGPPHFGLQAVQEKLNDYEALRGGPWKPSEEQFRPNVGMMLRGFMEGEYYEGRIVSGPELVVDNKGGGGTVETWRVEWEDGDAGDYEIDELYQLWPGCQREPTPAEGRALASLELFSGRGVVTHYFWKLGFRVQSIDNDPLSNATLKADIRTLEPAKDLKHIPDCIWASPPCQTYSNMAAGKHRTQEKPEKTEEAREHNFYFMQMEKFIRFTLQRHPHAIVLIENPVGLLAYMPLMKNLEKELGLYKALVDYCMFGREERKPTYLWTNDRGLHARLCGFRCNHPAGSHVNLRLAAHEFDFGAIPEQLASLVASYVYSKLTLDGVRDRPAKSVRED